MKFIRQIAESQMHLEYLKAEWYKDHYRKSRESGIDLDQLNPMDSADSKLIKDLLLPLRSPILKQIPSGTEWHLAGLEHDDFESLLIIRELGWIQTFGMNISLKDVALAYRSGVVEQGGVNLALVEEIKNSIGSAEFNEKLVLISTSNDGPYTIIDGNHRGLAFELKLLEKGERSHLPDEVIVGTSPHMSSAPWLNFG